MKQKDNSSLSQLKNVQAGANAGGIAKPMPAQIGSYEVEDIIKNGTMSVVYKVRHQTLRTLRALKMFRLKEGVPAESQREKFLSEGRILSSLNHPRVIHMHDFEIDSSTGLPYYTMDLVLSPSGEILSLADEEVVRDWEEKDLVSCFCDLCEGLGFLMHQGILHRDLKLDNVLVGPDGHVVLIDFGLSYLFSPEDDKSPKFMVEDEDSKNLAGSYFYAAPELLSNHASFSDKTEAWALGVLMFRLLTGFWFDATRRSDYLALTTDYDYPWTRLFERLFSKSAKHRLSAGGFRALPNLLGLNVTRRKHFPLWAAGLLLLVGACGIGALGYSLRSWSAAHTMNGEIESRISASRFQADCAQVMSTSGLTYYVYQTNRLSSALERLKKSVEILPEEFQKMIYEELEVAYSGGVRLGRSTPRSIRARSEKYLDEALRQSSRGSEATSLLFLASACLADDKRHAPYGDFAEARNRVAEAAVRFARYYVREPDWVYECLSWTGSLQNQEAYSKMVQMTDLQRELPYWLLGTWRYQAGDGFVSKAANERHQSQASYSAQVARLSWSKDFATIWSCYQSCVSICADDLRVVRLMVEKLKPYHLAEAFLDAARLSDRYDTLLPSFYVTERWHLLANGYVDADTMDAQKYYESPSIRSETCAVIRRYQNRSCLIGKSPRRHYLTQAIFAAVAEMCGERDLARQLVQSLPDKDVYLYLQIAVSPKTKLFQCLRSYYPVIKDEKLKPTYIEKVVKPKMKLEIECKSEENK